MSKKIAVRKAMQMDTKGNMSYVMDVGGKQSGGNRGPTKREYVGGKLGGAIGVLGALTGSHRSLGGLAGSMYAGGMQGSAAGRGLAGSTVSRTRRARAKLVEAKKQEDAQLAAEHQKEFGASGRLFQNTKDLAQQRRAYLAEMGQQLADQKLDEKMGMKDFRQFQQKYGDLMADANTRPEAMANIRNLMRNDDALLQESVNVKNVGPSPRAPSNAPVLPPQMSGPEGAHTQIAQEYADHDSELRGMADATGSAPQNTPQDEINAIIARALETQNIIGEAQGTTPGL